MKDKPPNLYLIVIALWVIQTVLTVETLRTELETMLILSLIPGLDLFIEVLQVTGSSDTGSIWYAVRILVVFLKDAIIVYLIDQFRKKRGR